MKSDTSIPSAISEQIEKHRALFEKHFYSGMDEQTSVLKAHLLIEGLLRDFCYSSVPFPEHLRKARLSFTQILNLTKSCVVLAFPEFDDYWSKVEKLNRMRNLMAHELEPNEAVTKELRQALISGTAATEAPEGSIQPSTLHCALASLCGSIEALLHISLLINNAEFKELGRKKS